MTADDERIHSYVAGLPEASGTFTGTYDLELLDALSPDAPALLPFLIDTGDEPNPAATFISVLTVRSGEKTWEMPVHHVDLLGGNRVRVWVRRPHVQGAE